MTHIEASSVEDTLARSAMKLALEAFKKLGDFPHAFDECTNAIKALEEALAKQEKEYPFGVYNAEDLDKAWKSGYDNCKAQAVWTLEDVKNAWKRGYASAKKECRAKEAKEKP
jgi:hypothetical protein